MRVAVATDNGNVAPHFGRCMEYTLYDIENNEITNKVIVANPGHEPGAIPKFLNEHGCNMIIAGGMGGRAQAFFAEFGIEWIIGASGDVDNVIANFVKGLVVSGESTCTHGEGHGDGTHGHEHCSH